eukprot:scaffold131376_cov63-Phaeocystis_antarctica.AAC.4
MKPRKRTAITAKELAANLAACSVPSPRSTVTVSSIGCVRKPSSGDSVGSGGCAGSSEQRTADRRARAGPTVADTLTEGTSAAESAAAANMPGTYRAHVHALWHFGSTHHGTYTAHGASRGVAAIARRGTGALQTHRCRTATVGPARAAKLPRRGQACGHHAGATARLTVCRC